MTENKNVTKKKATTWLLVAGLTIALAVGALVVLLAAEKHTGRAEFCGTQCHIMKANYATWKKDKHFQNDKETGKNVICIDCHYRPGEKATKKAKFRGLGQLFSYLATGDKEVRKRAVVNDESCTSAKCHPSDKLLTKPIEYKKKYSTKYKGNLKPFTHKTHLDKTIEGQKLHCSSCHVHQSRDSHFEVPKDLCFLCHFRKAKENEGRSKCAVCHEIPEKPLQVKQGLSDAGDDKPKKPITHKSLENAKVSCSRCHLEMMIGNAAIKTDMCLECHHDATPELLAKGKNRKLMHEEHVTKQTARCFQCHETIDHKKSSYLDTAIKNCAGCHPEPHFYTKKLLAGVGGVGVNEKFPSLMHAFGTNCIGCHGEDGRDAKGNKVRKGSNKTCVECHNREERYGKMTEKWGNDIKESLAEAKQIEKTTLDALAESKGNIPNSAYAKAVARVKEGQENLRVVSAGGGVHNKKYAQLLIDTALTSFENAMLELKATKPKGGTDAN